MTALDREIRDARHARVAAEHGITEHRDGIEAEGETLKEVLYKIADHPAVTDGEIVSAIAYRTATRAYGRAVYRERGAGVPTAATCWQGHEVPLVDGVGRCHCGETIEIGKVEVE